MRLTLLDEPPAPLPEPTLDALRAAPAETQKVERAYLVGICRTDDSGTSTVGRTLELVPHDAPTDEPPPWEHVRAWADVVGPILVAGGAADVGIGFPAPRALPVVEQRGVLVWAREQPAGRHP